MWTLEGEPSAPPCADDIERDIQSALYMTVLILATQRRENELASHHEHLTLELAILSEQKTAKIISLLEELRQDHPDIHDRIDDEAAAMSEPADPQSVLETIKRHM
jgi:uncharacterized membrane protein